MQVTENADRPTGGVRGFPDPLVGGLVVAVVAVAEVHAGDVHSRFDQRLEQINLLRGGPESADDLSASSHDAKA
ncbi:hypothetical protein Mkiyose1665_44280 [Mycobacterium kiyosense]|uniref:Uncharacterized protein n=1 Tax=Mycobacterium kiyosense TaxID=2871094 RepID=A0A9P3Q900_9MYCO|nr:hypothetical protein IWGMT90018_33330 [Mycobacterium kiyosense]BDE13879.1 hypothetical protein MKCMC460_27390 [Mycobacterium sp. 20KCMC460]GLB83768.1 hypothetical protein SRL2020028_30240 [Mycobacterium kiyosense]GLB91349.1 hypothetical protein SRL2020130_41660 [Mycobacterium kiyosense]GLB97224.1 hypothetical protein SRL2020226_40000 [Mycobacterium kiyosense]